MDGLVSCDMHGFGPCRWMQNAEPASQRAHGARPSQLRSNLRVLCPAKPGVYGMLDETGELIYVGKAKLLRQRLLSYFRPRSRPAKAGRVLRHTRTIVWETCAHEFAALVREQELIRRWRPRWNVQGQPLRCRLAFLCVGRGPGPYAYLTRQPAQDAVAVFGPISGSEHALRAVQRLNDHFQLRDCPSPQEITFPEQGGLFPLVRPPGCLRAELGTCLAPCTGACERTDYAAQVKAAVAFLAGDTKRTLGNLQQAMVAAGDRQQFERAASLRDAWTDLTWLAEQLARLRHAQEAMSFVYPLPGWDGSVHWFLIHGARVVECVSAPTVPEEACRVAGSLSSVYGGKKLGSLLTPYEHHDGRLIVMQWFRQRPRERQKIMSVEQAHAHCACLAAQSA